MKHLISMAAILMTAPAMAQAPQGMDQQDMQVIMQQMQEMQAQQQAQEYAMGRGGVRGTQFAHLCVKK